MKGFIKFVIGRFYLKGVDKFVKKRRGRKIDTIGEVSCTNTIGLVQKMGGKGQDPKTSFFSVRGYKICQRVFSLKGVIKFVKKRRCSKIGTKGEVSCTNTIG